MTGDIEPNLMRAREALDNFRIMVDIGRWHIAAREAYFAAFHSAYIILDLAGVRAPKTHSGLHSVFSDFARTDPEIGSDLSAVLGQGFDHKQFSDYGSGRPVSRDDAQEAVEKARKLLAIAERRAVAAGLA